MLVPDVLGDVGAADDLAGAAGQILQQRELARRQRHFAAVRARPAGPGRRSRRRRPDALGGQRAALAAGQRPHSGQQLAEVERLGQVVVGAGVEPLRCAPRPRRARSASARDVGARSRSSRHTVRPSFSGQHDVEDDGVVVVLGAMLRRDVPRRARSTAYDASRSPLAMNRAALGSSSTRSIRMQEIESVTVYRAFADGKAAPRQTVRYSRSRQDRPAWRRNDDIHLRKMNRA